VNAELIRSLVRMGLYVGYHTEHPATMEELDRVAGALAAPVVEAGGAEVSASYDTRCEAWTAEHGRCCRWRGHDGEKGARTTSHAGADRQEWF